MLNSVLLKWLKIPYREDTLFSVLFLFLLIAPVMFTTYFVEGFESVKYFLCLLLIGVALLVVAKRKTLFANRTAVVLLGVFLLFNLLSTLFSVDIAYSIVGLYGRYSGSLLFIAAWVLLIPIIWTVTKKDEQRKLTILRLIFFQGLTIAIYAILQQYGIGYYVREATQVRTIVPSFLGNQNFYAMYLLGSVATIGILWQAAIARIARYYYLSGGVIIILAIILAGSRGALLGLAALCVTYFAVLIIKKHSRPQFVVILSIVLLSGLLYFAFYPVLRSDVTNTTVTAAENTANSRFIVWADSIKLIGKKPLLGYGHGNFTIAIQSLGELVLSGQEQFDDAHNLFLNLAVTVGLPALAALLLLIAYSVYTSLQKTSNDADSLTWGLATMAGILVAACFNPLTISNWILLALTIVFCTGPRLREYSIDKKSFRIFVTCIGGLLILIAICFTASEIFSTIGIKAYKSGQNDKAYRALNISTLLNPANTSPQVYLINSMINKNEDVNQTNSRITKFLSQHSHSSQAYNKGAVLSYKLYVQTKDNNYRVQMNQYLEKAEQLQPNYPAAKRSQAYLEYKSGQNDKAIASLTQYLSTPENGRHTFSWLLLAQIYLEVGNKEKALFALERAHQQIPSEPLLKDFIEKLKLAKPEDVTNMYVPVNFPEADL